jgi:glycosyltransferase involved in cell wall biosynthesis
MAEPLVSVIVPVFNCERYLALALDSIFDQGYEALDVIVVDDGSTDGSADIAASYPVRLLRLDHGGIAHARNAGVNAARADLIGFLDADDVWTPDSLRIRVDHLLEHPDLDAVFGYVLLFLEPGTERPAWYQPLWETRPQHSLLPGMIARRRVFDRIGLFDTAYDIGEDTDWLARYKDAKLTHERIQAVVTRYRRHSTNTTNRRETIMPNMMRILKASLERQRVEAPSQLPSA